MSPDTTHALLARLEALHAEIDVLQATVAAEELAPNERQYLGRCFDLLHIELDAVRQYLARIG